MIELTIPMPVVVVCGLLYFFNSRFWDTERIKKYVKNREGQLRTIHRVLLSPEWHAGNNSRIYSVMYRDSKGTLHETLCRATFLGSVYWGTDRVVHPFHGQTSSSE